MKHELKKADIEMGHKMMAEAMGYFRQEGQPKTWFANTGVATVVAAVDDPYDARHWHPLTDWNQLMSVVNMLTHKFPKVGDEFPEEAQMFLPKGEYALQHFKLDGFRAEVKYYDHSGSVTMFHTYVPNQPNLSDCDSYMEAVWKTCFDFITHITT